MVNEFDPSMLETREVGAEAGVAKEMKRVAVVGMGNLLRSDDGVGVHVLHRLQRRKLKDVGLIDAGTAVIHAADDLRGADHIVVIDALKGGRAPGTIYLMSGADVFENDQAPSDHSLALKTALWFLAPDEDVAEWTLVGVEPLRMARGMKLSRPVWEAIPGVVRTVENLIEEWRS